MTQMALQFKSKIFHVHFRNICPKRRFSTQKKTIIAPNVRVQSQLGTDMLKTRLNKKNYGYKLNGMIHIPGLAQTATIRTKINDSNTSQQIFEVLENYVNQNDNNLDVTVFGRALQKSGKMHNFNIFMTILKKYCFNSQYMNKLHRNEIFYGILFHIGCQLDGINEIYPKYFEIMINYDKIKPNNEIMNSLLNGIKYSTLKNKYLIKEFLLIMKKYNLKCDKITYQNLITIYGRCGDLKSLNKVILKLENLNKNKKKIKK